MKPDSTDLRNAPVIPRLGLRRVLKLERRMTATTHTSVDCITCAARSNGLCMEMAPSDLLKIRRLRSGTRTIPAGRDIFAPGEDCDTIYNLVEGWAFRYSLLADGQRQILDFALPGAVLGFHPANGAKSTYGVQALTDAVLCTIPRKNLVLLFGEMPESAMRLAWLVSRDRSLAYDRLASVGRQSARERVAHLILELFIRYHAQWPGYRADEMHLPLTQEHVGDALGLTSVHVNRVLRELREEGVLEFHYRQLRVSNPDKLVEIAQVDPQLAMHWSRKAAEPAGTGVEGEQTQAVLLTASLAR